MLLTSFLCMIFDKHLNVSICNNKGNQISKQNASNKCEQNN